MMTWATAAVLAVATLTPGTELPSPAQIMAVPPELQAQLRDQVIQKSQSKEQRLQLLMDFMSGGERGLTLGYERVPTRTVEESFRSGRSNCVSFTLLFVALAREAGLQAGVQEIKQALVWYKEDGVIYNAGHINARVKAAGPWRTVDVAGAVVIARDQPEAISDQRALAYFYNNRGVELMVVDERAAARRHLDEAIALDPSNASFWNNLGVLGLRNGDYRAAERAYATALEHDQLHGAALSNIVTLYQRMGGQAQAAKFMRRLEKAQLADPFHQFLLATEFEKRGDYETAVTHYRRAIRLHGQESEFHFGLARTYVLMGQANRAERSLARAYALSDEGTRRIYENKLESLRHGSKRMESAVP